MACSIPTSPTVVYGVCGQVLLGLSSKLRTLCFGISGLYHFEEFENITHVYRADYSRDGNDTMAWSRTLFMIASPPAIYMVAELSHK